MPRRRQTQPVRERWERVLAGVDAARMRRGRTLAHNGSIVRLRVVEGSVEARVLSSSRSRQTYQVTVPCPAWWAPMADEVATWFVHRPDWFAAWLAGEWPEDLLGMMTAAGYPAAPSEPWPLWLYASACTCPDWGFPCKHVLAVVVRMAEDIERDPPMALEYAGIPREVWLAQVHRAWRTQLQEEHPQRPWAGDGVTEDERVLEERALRALLPAKAPSGGPQLSLDQEALRTWLPPLDGERAER